MRFRINRSILKASIAASIVVTSTAVCESSLPGNRTNFYRPTDIVGLEDLGSGIASWTSQNSEMVDRPSESMQKGDSDTWIEECVNASFQHEIRKNVDRLLLVVQKKIVEGVKRESASLTNWVQKFVAGYSEFLALNQLSHDIRIRPNGSPNLFVFALDDSSFSDQSITDFAPTETNLPVASDLETIESQCWHEQLAISESESHGPQQTLPPHEVTSNAMQRGMDPICPELHSEFCIPYYGCVSMPDPCYDEIASTTPCVENVAMQDADHRIPFVGPQLPDGELLSDERIRDASEIATNPQLVTEDDFIPLHAIPEFEMAREDDSPIIEEQIASDTRNSNSNDAENVDPEVLAPIADITHSRRLIESWLEPNWNIRKWELTTSNRSLGSTSRYFEAMPKRRFPFNEVLGPDARMLSEIPIDPLLYIDQNDTVLDSIEESVNPQSDIPQHASRQSTWIHESFALGSSKIMNYITSCWDSVKASSDLPKRAIAKQFKQIGLFFLKSADQLDGNHSFAERDGRDSIR